MLHSGVMKRFRVLNFTEYCRNVEYRFGSLSFQQVIKFGGNVKHKQSGKKKLQRGSRGTRKPILLLWVRIPGEKSRVSTNWIKAQERKRGSVNDSDRSERRLKISLDPHIVISA